MRDFSRGLLLGVIISASLVLIVLGLTRNDSSPSISELQARNNIQIELLTDKLEQVQWCVRNGGDYVESSSLCVMGDEYKDKYAELLIENNRLKEKIAQLTEAQQ